MKKKTITKLQYLFSRRVVIILGIIFVSFNLRPAITAVGPLVSDIRLDLGISNSLAGLITTLPLLSFAIFSLLAPKLGNRFGKEVMVFAGLITLMCGILIRSTGFTITLFFGTALVGIGIGIANVILPSIVKNSFPERIGLLTGIYTTSMSSFAALGSGISVPLAINLNLGWQYALIIWSGFTIVAIVIWVPQLRKSEHHSNPNVTMPGNSIWKSNIAWQVTIFMGLQSFLFYCMIAWLPEILSSSNISLAAAGWLVSAMQIAGLPMTFLTPIFANKFQNQKGIVLFIGILYLFGISGILFGSNLGVLTAGILLIGAGQGASISLSLTLIGLRAANGQEAVELSGMAQSVGYALAALGPVLMGYLLDLTGSSTVLLYVFLAVVLIMIAAGFGAGRNRTVFNE
ncbi:CynX/NimT family MFS transporter [Evansella tamaricis]|uniref:MFS transporter n=1 Tax=Evansella tamaricis TaxID=2069301 RepID=A0ABS6JIS8_9BACI|nr:MFS transporter [Evansella tamaricis]MBU9713109.1 MFS transporter [Evansella tamaricis]